MKKSIVFMFSGQGSQYYHMGKELYESHPRFRLWMEYCDEIAQSALQLSLVEELYHAEKKNCVFDRVLYTNPALLCVEFSLAKMLMEMNIQPDYLLGYSFGEITASIVSGSVSLEDGIEFAIAYAKLLEADAVEGGMLAVLDSPELFDQHPEWFRQCWLTGTNFHSNFVVSGEKEALDCLETELKKRNIVHQRLAVKYPFHTRLIESHKEQFDQLVQQVKFFPARIPMISALSGKLPASLSVDHWWKVVRYPVDFQQTVASMLSQGEYIFVDVGPSGTLASFVKYLLPDQSRSMQVEVINQFGRNLRSVEKLKQVLSSQGVTGLG